VPPRQRRASVRTAQDDFHRPVPGRTPLARLSVRARHRSHGLATVVRLPTLVRSPMLSHGRARPHGLGEGFGPRRAARGLAPPVDFCNRIAPRARPWTIRTPRTAPAVARRRSSSRGWLRLVRADPRAFDRGTNTCCARPTELSRARDRVSAVTRLHRPDASVRDRSRRELCPAPLGSDTSCCKLVVRRLGAIPPHPRAVAGARSELAMVSRRR
jgi:hypothetical protein